MKVRVAFAQWDNRIAPVFDSARQIHTVEVESGEVVAEALEHLPSDLPAHKALRLAELGISTVICGAISRTLYEQIRAYGIQVVPFVTGELHSVVGAWLKGELKRDIYAMPGCWGRGCGRSLPAGRSTLDKPEDYFMNGAQRGGMGRGGGGGQGSGQGQGRGQGGSGRGRQGGPFAGGPGGYCVCPQCGQREPHGRGVPCMQMKCPKCGAAMTRE
jgi:predicted Fe-Mo cluster-binding NifX family protein